MSVSKIYSQQREARLIRFLELLESRGIAGRVDLAEAIEETAPPGWPLDFGSAPTLSALAEALELGEVVS